MESAGATTINALGLYVTIIFGIITLFLPKKYAFIPLLAIGVTMTLGQIWYVAGMNFSIMRIIVLFSIMRVIIRKEFQGITFNEIDKAIVIFVAANVIVYTARDGTSEAFVNRLGFGYNALGIYFIFRFLVRSEEDIQRVIKVMAILVLPLAASMLLEKATGRNLYSYFGGVNEYTAIRGGQLRSQGPFRHPVLAGTFGAVTIPLIAGLWLSRRERMTASLSVIAATMVVFASASGGPVLSFVSAWIGLAAWKIRKYMRTIRWGILLTVLGLHFVMKSPVWYLIGRSSGIVGGTGWHRAELINQFLSRWDEWIIAGTGETAHWMPYTLSRYQQADITNYFIRHGVDGGLLTLFLFIALIGFSFRKVGRSLREMGKGNEQTKEHFWVWGIGVSLFTHVVSFFGISYFDQMVIYWYSLLAMISSLPVTRSIKKPAIKHIHRRHPRSIKFEKSNAI